MKFIVDKISDREYVMKYPVDTSPYYINPDAYVLTDKKYVGEVDEKVKSEIIKSTIIKHLGIPEDLMFSPARDRELVEARQLYAYLLKKETQWSLKTIGRTIGNKDHATVVHSVKVWNNLLETEQRIRIITMAVIDKYKQTILETEKDKTLVLENEDIIAKWELIKDKKDDKGNYLYR